MPQKRGEREIQDTKKPAKKPASEFCLCRYHIIGLILI